MKKNIIFALSAAKEIANEIENKYEIPISPIKIIHFADGEILVKPMITVRGEDVTIIQSINDPVNENLMELLIAIDAIKRSSAHNINVIIPYMGYSRQDRKSNPHEPITFKLVANMLQVAGATRIVTFDIHSEQTQGFFDIPFDSLQASLFLLDEFIAKTKINNFTVVSPDYGGIKRAKDISQKFNLPLAIIDKRRPAPNEVEVTNILGDVKEKNCVIFDDMIDTGGTMVAASKLLKEKGAKTVNILVTHGLFNKNAEANFKEAYENNFINNVFVTNTIHKEMNLPNLHIVSVARPIAKIIDLFTVGHGSMSCIIKDGVHDIIAEIKKMLNNNAK